MPRLLFEKTGDAVWMSHLDLMRLFQRAFKRAELPLKHTQGFNPRPSVSIALPLSVGVSSRCELLDFDLDGVEVPNEDILIRLNQCLVCGVKGLAVYDHGRKLKDLALLQCEITLEYDAVRTGAAEEICKLFNREQILATKKTKNGVQEQDIRPMIQKVEAIEQEGSVILNALICCQNPSLNPSLLTQAISLYIPDYAPDFSYCRRIEIYDRDGNIFR